MNDTARDFDWNHARAFLATAERGSLSAAARHLNLAQPTLSRQVAALEASLGVNLFERVGRGLLLTPAGKKLLSHVKAMDQSANSIILAATGQAETLSGKVTISASDFFAANILPRALAGLQEIAPQIDIEILAANQISDLQRREADIALRHLRPSEPELIGKFLGDAKAALYGASSYLDTYGRFEEPRKYNNARFVGIDDANEMLEYLKPLGINAKLENVRYTTTNGIVGWEIVRSGMGLTLMADIIAKATPNIEAVCPKHTAINFPVWIIAHKDVQTSAAVRVVWDYLETWIKTEILSNG